MKINVSPNSYILCKPKTYKEDFLERFPNAILTDGENPFPISCVFHIYGAVEKADCSDIKTCEDCWNTVMPEEE